MVDLKLRKKTLFILYVLVITLSITGCKTDKTSVDSIIIAPKIYVCNDEYDIVEALAINDGKIIASGTKRQIKSQYSTTNLTEYEGIVYPGFIDAHSHFYGYGLTLNKIDLRNTSGMESIVQKIVAFSNDSKEIWITGRGWDQTQWEEKGNLSNNMLNAYFPDRPIFIKRVDGHAGLANNAALALAGITTSTIVSGGEIETMGGRLTGILTDNAMNLIDDIVPEPSRESAIDALLKAQKNCFAAGLTTVTDAGLDLSTILLIDSLQKVGDLTMRVYAMCNPNEENLEFFEENGPISSDLLQVSSFKIYADGSLGSRGAKLKESYCDHPNYTGVWVTEPTDMDSLCSRILKMNFQTNTHAIGDSANRMVLDIYGKYLKTANDRRWRIEHAQVVTPSDRELFSKYSIIPSVQPTHATSDMHWADDRLCQSRMVGAYAYRSLLELNGWMPLGTDFPVEEIYPLNTFFAAVYRQNNKYQPVGGFLLEESLRSKDALLGMTLWAAKGNKMEDKIGSLEVGKFADYVVLDNDITTEKYMITTKIIGTYHNGKKVD